MLCSFKPGKYTVEGVIWQVELIFPLPVACNGILHVGS